VPGGVARTRRPVRSSSGAGRATRAVRAPGGSVLAGVDGRRRVTRSRGGSPRMGQVWVRCGSGVGQAACPGRRARGLATRSLATGQQSRGNRPRAFGNSDLAPPSRDGVPAHAQRGVARRHAAVRPPVRPPAPPTIPSRGVVGPSESLRGCWKGPLQGSTLSGDSRALERPSRSTAVGRLSTRRPYGRVSTVYIYAYIYNTLGDVGRTATRGSTGSTHSTTRREETAEREKGNRPCCIMLTPGLNLPVIPGITRGRLCAKMPRP
jgi:hypothetical protein